VRQLWVVSLGTIPYADALELQRSVAAQRISGEVAEDVLLLMEHPPVVTLGRSTKNANLTASPELLKARGVELFEVERGGDVTFHGPGQLVGYPIMRTDDVLDFVRTMERAIVAALGETGLTGRSREAEGRDYTGVWIDDRKVASIGVHLSRGVSSHGFAVNVTNDLQPFSWVVPCGLPAVRMTSLAAEGSNDELACFRRRMAHRFCEAFGRRQRLVTPERLAACAPEPVGTLST